MSEQHSRSQATEESQAERRLGGGMVSLSLLLSLLVAFTLSGPAPEGRGGLRSIDNSKNSGANTQPGGEQCHKCSGPECNEMGKLLNHLIDPTVDPCDDFLPSPAVSRLEELLHQSLP